MSDWVFAIKDNPENYENNIQLAKMTRALFTGAFCLGALGLAAQTVGTPTIRFEQTLCDFGKISQVTTTE
jgi:hypothetical protein